MIAPFIRSITISLLAIGLAPKLAAQPESQSIDTVQYFTAISLWQDEEFLLTELDNVRLNSDNPIRFTGVTLQQLYGIAYGTHSESSPGKWRFASPIVETKDQSYFQSESGSGSSKKRYNFVLNRNLPSTNKWSPREQLQAELFNAFGYDVVDAELEVSVYKLQAKPQAAARLQSREETRMAVISKTGIKATRLSRSEFYELIASLITEPNIGGLVADDLNLPETISLQIRHPDNIKILAQELARYGLLLKLEKVRIKTIRIRD